MNVKPTMDFSLSALTFWFLIFLTSNVYAYFGVGYDGEELYLSENQDQTITFDCSNIRSGTIRLAPEVSDCADSNFHVNFRVKYGPRCRGYFRFYINLRKLHLDHNEEIRLFDSMYSRRYSRTYLGQHLPGFTEESRAESVSQFFTSRDSLRLEYSRAGKCDQSPTDLVLDFTLVQTDKKRTHDEFFCPTLRGYVPRILFCANDSHITCPDGFRWTNDVRNPAFNRNILDRCKDTWLPADLPEFIDQWVPHGIPGIPQHHDEHNEENNHSHRPSWFPSTWYPASWIPSSLIPAWFRPDNSYQPYQNTTNPYWQSNNPADYANNDKSEFHKRIVGFGGPYDSDTDLPDPIVFDEDIPDKPDTTDKPETTDKPDKPDTSDTTDLPEWTDAPDVEDADDGPLQAPWRSPPLRLSRVQHRQESDSHHHHNRDRMGVVQILLVSVAAVLVLIILPLAALCWCCRKGQHIEYHRLQTDHSTCAPPGGYGTFDPNHGGQNYYAQGGFNGPNYGTQPSPTVRVSAPFYPYSANEVKVRPPN